MNPLCISHMAWRPSFHRDPRNPRWCGPEKVNNSSFGELSKIVLKVVWVKHPKRGMIQQSGQMGHTLNLAVVEDRNIQTNGHPGSVILLVHLEGHQPSFGLVLIIPV